MALLPYMKQLPQDYYKNNYPAPVVIVAAPVEAEPWSPPVEAQLGTPLPPVTGGDGGIPEAPTDGRTYARESAAWTSTWEGGSY